MSFKRLIVAFAAFPLLAGTASAAIPVTTHVPVASPPACVSAAGPAQHLPARAPLAIREQRAALAYAASRIGCLGRGASGRTALLRAFTETRALHRLATGGGSWRSIGPNTTKPQVYNFDTGAGTSPVSGRVLALAYDGHLNGGTLFAGTAGGGIWSTSNGKSWTTHTDRMPSLAIDALTVDPTDPTGKTIYAGTGEQDAAGDAMLGAGIYKSTNGGLSWTVEGQHLFAGETVADIVLDPTSAGCVSPKTGCRVYAGESSTFGGFGGLAASTDGGKTWLFKTGTNISDQSVTALAIDSHGDIYASVSQPIPRAPTASNGIYVSSNHGKTWIRISKGLPGSPAGAGGLYYKMTLASP
ncbi:MAG TPA: sialidase family protein, partial [Pirellulales bacterium]|nr:sialidase family protein [Pirellulales bacterium]